MSPRFSVTSTPPKCLTAWARAAWQLFEYRGLYFHLQDFDEDQGGRQIQEARHDHRFQQISEDLKPLIEAYDPATWRSPADAMAKRFYSWEASA